MPFPTIHTSRRFCRPWHALLIGALIVGALTLALANAVDARPAVAGAGPAPLPLRFGIYPGGYVGAVGASSEETPEDAAAREAALTELGNTGRALVLHLYAEWNGTSPLPQAVADAVAEAHSSTAAGHQVELVLRYRPATPDSRAPATYATFVRGVARSLAGDLGVVALQVANEVNVAGSPAAADGAYPGARRALVAGVIAASDELRQRNRADLGVGFNWASAGNTGPDLRFWRALRRLGGTRFARAVAWVGADIYPGTWTPGADTAASVSTTMTAAFRQLRDSALPAAGLGAEVALQVSENGFPTSGTRSEQTQATLLAAAVDAVQQNRVRYGISDYRWFDLRDARTGGGQEDGYGLLRDDYSRKPAFAVLAALVQRLGR